MADIDVVAFTEKKKLVG